MSNNKDINTYGDFRIYNNCLIPNVAPNEIPNISDVKSKLKSDNLYLARWTDSFDSEDSKKIGQWWYLIKDGKWDLSELKSHDRNEIKKGVKNFECRIIDINDYIQKLYEVYNSASAEYSSLSNNVLSFDDYKNTFNENTIVIGAFDKEDDELSAYATVYYYNKTNGFLSNAVNLNVLKIAPEKKKKSPSAALMNYVCEYFLNEKKVDYICDGERSIRHVTNFQNYLEKYFGFKKVYCRLNVVYNNKIKILVKVLYPFRKIILKFSKINKKIYNIYVILKQEEIVKSFKNRG